MVLCEAIGKILRLYYKAEGERVVSMVDIILRMRTSIRALMITDAF